MNIFGRHHLFELEKYLFACGATVTLPRSFHNHIEYLSKTMYGKEIQEKLLSTVNNMVLKDGLITLTDIDNYLSKIDISLGTDNITVADLWKGGRTTQELNNFLNRWNKARKEIKNSKFYDMINENFKHKNGDNPILEKYWGTAQNVIAVYRMVEDFNDFSYLFTQNDKKFLKNSGKFNLYILPLGIFYIILNIKLD